MRWQAAILTTGVGREGKMEVCRKTKEKIERYEIRATRIGRKKMRKQQHRDLKLRNGFQEMTSVLAYQRRTSSLMAPAAPSPTQFWTG